MMIQIILDQGMQSKVQFFCQKRSVSLRPTGLR